jgi:hypothetical protein
MHGLDHDPGTRIPLLWTRTPKVCALYDLGVYGLILGHRLPMVLLGLFFGV